MNIHLTPWLAREVRLCADAFSYIAACSQAIARFAKVEKNSCRRCWRGVFDHIDSHHHLQQPTGIHEALEQEIVQRCP